MTKNVEDITISVCGNARRTAVLEKTLTKIFAKLGYGIPQFTKRGTAGKKSYLVSIDGFSFDSTTDSVYNTIVVKYADNGKSLLPFIQNGGSVFTYSTGNNGADLMAKNIVKTGGFAHFELLGINAIGRVKYSESCGFSVEELLAVASVLLLAGIPFTDVTQELSTL